MIIPHGLKQCHLVLFTRQPANVDDLEWPLGVEIVGWHLAGTNALIGNHPVRDDLQTGVDVVVAQPVHHVLRRTLNSKTMIVYVFPGQSQEEAVDTFPMEQRPPMTTDILRMNMVGSGEGLP